MNLARKHHRKDLALTAEPVAARDQFSDLEQRFDEQAMDEELHALPVKYRDVLVRFYFLGQTSRQIAEALGITQGTADGRIKRGRQELRVRLAKRGVALGAISVVVFSAQTASAAVAPALVQSTVAAAVAKGSVGLCSPSVVGLAGTELMKTSSLMSSVAVASAAVVLLGLGVFGANAVFARAAMPSESPINTLAQDDEPGHRSLAFFQEPTGEIDADEQPLTRSNRIATATYRIDPPLKTKEAGETLKRFKVGKAVSVDINGKTLSVAGSRAEHAEARRILKLMADARNASIDENKAELLYRDTYASTRFQNFGPVKKELKKLVPSVKTNDAWGVFTVTGTKRDLVSVYSLLGRLAVDAFIGRESLDGLPVPKADDLYTFEKLRAREVITLIQAQLPKARLIHRSNDTVIVQGTMAERKAVAQVIVKIDPAAKRTELSQSPDPASGGPKPARVRKLQVGDTLQVVISKRINTQVEVQRDGSVSLPLLKSMKVAGLTMVEFAERLKEAGQKLLRTDEIDVVVSLVREDGEGKPAGATP
jgi:hypothetical protein